MTLKDKKNTVDIRHVGINSNGYREPEKEERDYNLRECRCGAKFKTNKYGIYTQCESCFEKNNNEQEMKIFNELTPIFMNPNHPNDCHGPFPDNHLNAIQQVDSNLFILDINEESCFDFLYDGIWKKKIEEEKKYKVLYEFSASDGIGNSILEWLIKKTKI